MWQNLALSVQSELNEIGSELSFAPPWIVAAILLVGVVVVAWGLHAATLEALRRLSRGRWPYLRTILDATRSPTRLALLVVAVAVALPVTPLEADTKHILGRVLLLTTICLFGWAAMTVLNIAADLYLRNFRIDTEDNLQARKHITQVRVLVRALDTIIVLVTLGFGLMTFDAVRQYGVSLFASAGVAGVVFGLAAQPVLSNL